MLKTHPLLVRLGLFALIAGVIAFPGMEGRGSRAAAVRADEPPLLGPIPVLPLLPAPECLPPDPPPPIVKVKVRVPAFGAPNETIEYRICVENCSPAEAHHVLLKNPLPANAVFVRADPEPSRLLPELQWQLGTIGGGACREVVLVLRPTNREDVKNCTRVQFEHGQCVTTRQSGYTPGTMPLAPEKEPAPKVPPEDQPKLSLTIDGHKQQYVNLPSHYFITVSNNGKTTATNLLVSCALPDATKLVRTSGNGKFAQGQVAWVIGNLEPGGQRTVELVIKAQSQGKHCVKATARADLGATATAEACTGFVGVSALAVEMTDRDDPLVVGGKTSYPILIRNPGSAAVTNLRLKALLPDALKLLDVKGPTGHKLGEKAPAGQWIELAPLARLEPMTSQVYEIFVEARRAGTARVHIEVSADQLERGPVTEEESTTLFDEDSALKKK